MSIDSALAFKRHQYEILTKFWFKKQLHSQSHLTSATDEFQHEIFFSIFLKFLMGQSTDLHIHQINMREILISEILYLNESLSVLCIFGLRNNQYTSHPLVFLWRLSRPVPSCLFWEYQNHVCPYT
jgi:hypothetical protein